MKRLTALSIVILGLVFQAEVMRASAFRVTPIQVELSGKSSALLTLTNESGQPLRFQISAFSWSQAPNGDMQLSPTQDISFFPSLLTLKAGEERKVRVGSNVIATDAEKTYRIFFEELPEEIPAGERRSEVKILTKMGVPIFVKAAKSVAEASVADLKTEGGHVTFVVKNTGNSHFSIRGVRVTAVDGSGANVLDRKLDGWYVLSNGMREYKVDLPEEACPRIRSIKVEATTDIPALKSSASTVTAEQTYSTAPSCGSNSK